MKKIIKIFSIVTILTASDVYAYTCPAPETIKCDAQQCIIPSTSLFHVVNYFSPSSSKDYAVKFSNVSGNCDSEETVCKDPIRVNYFHCNYSVGNTGQLTVVWSLDNYYYSILTPPWMVNDFSQGANCDKDSNTCSWTVK